MKLHFFTKELAPFSFELYIDIIDDEEFKSWNQEEDIDSILSNDDIQDMIREEDWSDLSYTIGSLFDKTTDGVFDWVEKTKEYYAHFNRMLHYLNCALECDGSGETIADYTCELCYEQSGFKNHLFSLYLPDFYCENGEPEGARLALSIIARFLKTNQWHIGFYDTNDRLITDITTWSKSNKLDIQAIKPIVWFGRIDTIHECWSITLKTTDSFMKKFWGGNLEGALSYICNGNAGAGIYYSIWEFGLYSGYMDFDDIKSQCPIDLNLDSISRANALFNLVESVYNEKKA